MRNAIFIVAILSTVFCAAVNAYTYRLAYPLWRWVGPREFGALHTEYLRLLTPVITVPHVLMFFACGALIFLRPAYMARWEAVALFTLAATVVGVSAWIAGPVHSQIERTGVLDDAGFTRLMTVSAGRVGMMMLSCGLLFRVLLRGLGGR